MIKVSSNKKGKIFSICQLKPVISYNTMSRPDNSNGLVIMKMKRDLTFCRHVHFETKRAFKICIALKYLKYQNKYSLY